MDRSVNLESKLWCPQFSQKTIKLSQRSFFGRIEDTIICFWDHLTFKKKLKIRRNKRSNKWKIYSISLFKMTCKHIALSGWHILFANFLWFHFFISFRNYVNLSTILVIIAKWFRGEGGNNCQLINHKNSSPSCNALLFAFWPLANFEE